MSVAFKQPLWISFGIVFGAATVAGVAIYFLSGDITAQADKIISDKTLVTRQAAVVGILASLKSDAPKAAQYSAAMKKLLPTHDELIGFSPWLNALGQTHNVSVAFSFRGDNAGATASSLGTDGFSLSVTGSSKDILSFLQDIETRAQSFLLSIDSFEFGQSDSGYRLNAQGRLFSR